MSCSVWKCCSDTVSRTCITANVTITDSPGSRFVTKRPLYNTELNTCKMRGKPVAERVVWLHHLYYWVRAQAREKNHFHPPQSSALGSPAKSLCFTVNCWKEVPQVCGIGGSAWSLPMRCLKRSSPCRGCPSLPLCVISEASVKAPCSFESIQALSTPHHDSTQTPLKICSRERYLLLSLQSAFKKTAPPERKGQSCANGKLSVGTVLRFCKELQNPEGSRLTYLTIWTRWCLTFCWILRIWHNLQKKAHSKFSNKR